MREPPQPATRSPSLDNLLETQVLASRRSTWTSIYLPVIRLSGKEFVGAGVTRITASAAFTLKPPGLARDRVEQGVSRDQAPARGVCRGGPELLRQRRQIGIG